MRSYYGSSKKIGQYGGKMTRPIAGLDEYTPATEINDNSLSDSLNVLPYRDHALNFKYISLSYLFSETAGNIGRVRAILPSYLADEDSNEIIAYLMVYDPTVGWSIKKAIHTNSEDYVSSYGMTSNNTDSDVTSCVFNTEAERYYCFANQVNDRLHFVRETADEYGYVDLPFEIKKMVAHANRIFAIDTGNRLWWSRTGDIFSWYTTDYDDDAITAAQNMKNGALTITSQPNTGRLLTFTHTKTDTEDTIGTVDVVGELDGEARSETVTLISEGRAVSTRHYDTITSITQAGWTQGGATPDTITLGVGPTGSKYVQADAGYWTLEQEEFLIDLCVLNESIYLFGHHNIYIFQGSSYSTFSAQLLIADVGMTEPSTKYGYGYSSLAVIKNTAFFKYLDDIYMFDGNSRPVIISHPVTTNGGSVNGVFSGIDISGTEWSLSADDDDLFVYQNNNTPTYYYRYNYQTKTWWKMSGIRNTDVGFSNNITILMKGSYTRKFMLMAVTDLDATDPEWVISYNQSSRMGSADNYPYIVTKAFNTNPSEDGTLTGIILQIKGTEDSTATITVSYNTTDNGTTFTAIKTYSSYSFSGDMEIFEIPVPVADIARQHHYRLKIQITNGNDVYLYNIERRFRILGRSR